MKNKKRRKPRPAMPEWFWWGQDGCWFCKNRNNCNSCKANRAFAKESLPKKYKGRHDGGPKYYEGDEE
ncbi:MAG: hypothetical protein IKY16_06810 [Bacteroidales bacterium]|nr:hypothetical protein [Bacteroidales bacterium]